MSDCTNIGTVILEQTDTISEQALRIQTLEEENAKLRKLLDEAMSLTDDMDADWDAEHRCMFQQWRADVDALKETSEDE